jgi:histone deacetylase 1/2
MELKKRVSYYFDDDIGLYSLGKGHPMKPIRMKITDQLIKAYGLDTMMDCVSSDAFTGFDNKIFTQFHTDEYIDLL